MTNYPFPFPFMTADKFSSQSYQKQFWRHKTYVISSNFSDSEICILFRGLFFDKFFREWIKDKYGHLNKSRSMNYLSASRFWMMFAALTYDSISVKHCSPRSTRWLHIIFLGNAVIFNLNQRSVFDSVFADIESRTKEQVLCSIRKKAANVKITHGKNLVPRKLN